MLLKICFKKSIFKGSGAGTGVGDGAVEKKNPESVENGPAPQH